MKILILRLDAPLVSFGAPSVDQHGVVQRFPALSMLVGLIANAMGWHHRDVERLEDLQGRLRYAARIDRQGEALIDYQTVALGEEWMKPERAGWTTRGRIAGRGGLFSDATHQRYRHYRADSLHTLALALTGNGTPQIEDIAAALREPARPLFLGRKCCLPAAPLLVEVIDADSPAAALALTPRTRRSEAGKLLACWSESDGATGVVEGSRVVAVTDERDWSNRVHVGRRLIREGHVDPPEARRG